MKKYEYKVIKTTQKTGQNRNAIAPNNINFNLKKEGWELIKTSSKVYDCFEEEEVIYTFKREVNI